MRAALVCVVGLAACGSPAPSDASTVRTFTDTELGVALDLPADWIDEQRGAGRVFSGPFGGDTYYTTVTIQPLEQIDADGLEVALERAYATVEEARGFAWERREPTTVAGRAALFYGVHFEHYEKLRRKACVLVDAAGWYLDLCYGATEELFPSAITVFADAVDSLRL